MARAVGIPARVAVGYTPGELDATTGRYSVTNYEAHAWPEIWLAGVGWTNQFDPTPPSTQPGGSDLPNEPAIAGTATPPPPSSTTVPTTVQTAPNGAAVPDDTPVTVPARDGAPVAADDSGRSWTTLAWVLALAVVVGVLVAAVPVAKAVRRRARRRRADPTSRVAGAWEEAVDRLRELGRPAPRTTTPAEHARAATATVGAPAAESLAALADAHTAAQFGAAPITDAAADAAWDDLDAFTGELGRHLPLTTRVRARMRLASLRRPRERRLGDPVDQPELVGASAAPSSSTND
jgi:hypothetical protein